MNNIFKIINYINDWQLKNDNEFKIIPNDNHSYLIFNHKNQIYKFVFSNKYKRNKCVSTIPIELLENYSYIMEQEDGLTYYLITTREL